MSDEGTAARAPASPPEKKRAPRAKAAEKTKLDEPVPQLVDDGGPEVEVTTTEFGAFFPVEVVDVLVRLPNPNPVLVLQTADPPARTLEIPIGSAEGISIANALRDVPTPKPLTHALFAETLTALGASVAVARITAVEGGAFYAEIVVSGGPSGQQAIVCRPSDAVAMALRQCPPAPIVASSDVLDAVGTAGDEAR